MDDQQGHWKASLRIVSKKCYGYGFGCSIDAKVRLGPEDATIEVAYKIKGAKDGPVVRFHRRDESDRGRRQHRSTSTPGHVAPSSPSP
jgi:hypothetical protein